LPNALIYGDIGFLLLDREFRSIASFFKRSENSEMRFSAATNPDDLRHRAIRYRAIAPRLNDAQTIQALHDLADEYEVLAARIEAQREEEASGDVSDDCGRPGRPIR
jgi:hypothetical protein